ncbi:Nicotinic receptor-associated protein 1 [Amphibalanus amphitrite]|uniref:Nicotinic receptor-associated protein 1 n=1 Tax=Amphibalanus amphitrite TaxID=1232801 RepID=A0A6A4V983_AMPAM|nr:Nicotinic receptor-associated protein 1 [Amphibalanus amphitrite]
MTYGYALPDRADTVAALVDASSLPMSVIIVGVGSEDFSAMEYLDSDNQKLRDDRGRIAARDIVQFVELRRHLQTGGAGGRDRLARDVLAELPAQLTEYMRLRGLKPGVAASGPAPPPPPDPSLPTVTTY